MNSILRQATRSDVSMMHRVRLAVRENRLTSMVITLEEYIVAIETTGRGWVIEVAGEVAGFSVGNADSGNIWALFVDPEHEGHGYGRGLHEVMIAWLFARGLERLWLTTAPQTRAQRFYERAGWQYQSLLPSGEVLYELRCRNEHALQRSSA
jgi:GNAT superfamily N-acetyltransferase